MPARLEVSIKKGEKLHFKGNKMYAHVSNNGVVTVNTLEIYQAQDKKMQDNEHHTPLDSFQ